MALFGAASRGNKDPDMREYKSLSFPYIYLSLDYNPCLTCIPAKTTGQLLWSISYRCEHDETLDSNSAIRAGHCDG